MEIANIKRVCPGALYLSLAFFLVLLTGCGGAPVVRPEIKSLTTLDFRLTGRINYDGNREYLPRTIVETSTEQPALGFRYTYNVVYGKDAVPQLLPLFNPLTLIGFPIGEDTLAAAGQLEMLRDGEVVRTYTATWAVEKTRNIFRALGKD